MSDSLQSFNIANDIDFQKRCRVLLLKLASVALNEANTVEHHDARALYATRAIASPLVEGERAQTPPRRLCSISGVKIRA